METIHFKASLIYETAEQAANVPLRTLEENGEQAATASLMEHPCLKWMHRLIHCNPFCGNSRHGWEL